jgi:hypothetical protein
MTTTTLQLGPAHRDADTERFYAATARRDFPICTCQRCGAVGGPQETQCHACGATSLTWSAASGAAVLRSWVVLHRPSPEGATTRVVVAIGELAEGPWWWAQVAGADPDRLVDGQPLSIDFAPAGAELLPFFRLG